jgi:hypothetical protein
MSKKQNRPAGDLHFRTHPDVIFAPGQPAPDEQQTIVPTEPDEPTEICVVAEGHSVHQNTGEKIMHSWDATTGKYVYRPIFKIFKPGDEITLPVSEAKRLRQTGHIVDPSKITDATHFDAKAVAAFDEIVKPGLVNTNANAGH